MIKSRIAIDVELDENKIPNHIEWSATDSSIEKPMPAKAMFLSLWDGQDKSELRIHLWTQKMMVDEMADFYFQMYMSMAETFWKSTHQNELAEEMRNFARAFHKKFQEIQMKENKAS
jgi:gliding motility-associated protein GldC